MKTVILTRFRQGCRDDDEDYDDDGFPKREPDKFIHILESFDKEYQKGDSFRCFEVIRKDPKNICVRFLKKPSAVDVGAAFDICAESFMNSTAANWHEARQDFITAVALL